MFNTAVNFRFLTFKNLINSISKILRVRLRSQTKIFLVVNGHRKSMKLRQVIKEEHDRRVQIMAICLLDVIGEAFAKVSQLDLQYEYNYASKMKNKIIRHTSDFIFISLSLFNIGRCPYTRRGSYPWTWRSSGGRWSCLG